MSAAFDALKKVNSGQRVFIQGGAATPTVLISALLEHAERLRNVEIIHIHTIDAAQYAEEKYKDVFRVANLFLGSNMRDKILNENVDYLPCFLSEIPLLFSSGVRPLDVALIHVSKPDRHGFCSLGTSVDITRSAVNNAKVIIAQVNAKMPRVHGDGFIHIDRIHHFVEVDQELPVSLRPSLSQAELAIGHYASEVIDDGATLQVGIGNIPDAVLNFLKDRKHLGLHTEMWSDGALDLIKSGVIDNSRKKIYPGRSVSGFVIGSKELYSYIDDNPAVIQLDIEYVNNPSTIARNPKVAAINSAVEIDLTGQVCADSIGSRIISGVGGQMDFMRGAAMSEGGRSIIAILSRTRKGVPRIVSRLKPGAGVVTTRAHVHHVITEFGRVDLFGKTLQERAKALIGIAHPEDRENLERQWHEMFL